MGLEITDIFPQLGKMTSEIMSYDGCLLSESTTMASDSMLSLMVLNL